MLREVGARMLDNSLHKLRAREYPLEAERPGGIRQVPHLTQLLVHGSGGDASHPHSEQANLGIEALERELFGGTEAEVQSNCQGVLRLLAETG